MNVVFHTLTAFAAAGLLSSRRTKARSGIWADITFCLIGLIAGVLIHGVLDFAPHAYPVASVVDVILSLGLFLVFLVVARGRHRLILGACFAGVVFPDLLDLGPQILNKRTGLSLPVVKVFPWHWKQYSGSIYDGSRRIESFLCHVFVVVGCLCVLWTTRSVVRRKEQ